MPRQGGVLPAPLAIAVFCTALALGTGATIAQGAKVASHAVSSSNQTLKTQHRWWKRPAAVVKSPTDRLIEGPVTVNTEWTTYKLDKPLTTLPHLQDLNILLSFDDYRADTKAPDHPEYPEFVSSVRSDDVRRISDYAVVQFDVRLVDSQGNETALENCCGSGQRWTVRGDFRSVAFNLPGDDAAYFPRDAQYTAIKIRTNVDGITVSHFVWGADHYYQAPNDTWQDAEREPGFKEHGAITTRAAGDVPLQVRSKWWSPHDIKGLPKKPPTSRLIEGPVTVNTEWTTFKLSKPLTTLPSLQVLYALFDYHNQVYNLEDTDPPGDSPYHDNRVKRVSDGVQIDLDVRLIDQNGKETTLGPRFGGPRLGGGGWVTVFDGEYIFSGFGLTKRTRVTYFPRDAEYTAIKVRANVDEVTVSHFLWQAPNYYRLEDKTWEEAEREPRFKEHSVE